MKKLVILGSSSTVTPPNPHHHRHHRHSPKQPSHSSSLHKSPLSSSSKPIPTVESHSPPVLSTVRWDLTTATTTRHNHDSLISQYPSLASKLAEEGRLLDFAMVAESVISSGVEPSHFLASLTVSNVAQGISKNLRQGHVRQVLQLLQTLEKLGVSSAKLFDDDALSLLKKECQRMADSGDVELLVDLLETVPGLCFSRKELAEPHRVIKICVEKRNPRLAVRYSGLFPNEQILLCAIIKEFGRKEDLGSALIAYEESRQKLAVHNMYLYRTIIDVCGLCGDYMKSRYIYEHSQDDMIYSSDGSPEQRNDLLNQKISLNIFVYNSLMNVNANDLGYILRIYRNMQNLGIKADMASYNILLKACCLAERVDLAKDIYQEVKKLESMGQLKLDVFTYCTIIKLLQIFADAKLWQMALKIKDDMLSAGVTPNTFTWSSLISACANAGLVEKAIKLFEEMILSGCEPNSQCCNSLLHACVEACQYDRAFRLFQSWKKNEVKETSGVDSTCEVYTTEHNERYSLSSVPKLVSSSQHLKFLINLPFKPTTTTYNTLMKACGSDYRRAKALMDEMRSAGVSPNHISWSILIDICGGLGKVETAMQILKNMRGAGVEPDVVTYTTAIKV
ncbi:hypothetical protein Tsubulata_007742 [Turnera subulata]|uniref:Pentacotripeptide-repeat region of PRORP domain-containing protein n=1 Tax=Turnera subulata TaxID=218843 RepID=A0A9Q0J388_9ROSI|nr:hypothetical protein Tsubulata_007742 [Turnera subulata]